MRQLKITKSITNRDSESFNKYLSEVGKLGDVISSEEEIKLARRIKKGDKKAENKLIEANLRFVISVAKQYSGKAPIADLIQAGNLGMIKAAQRFDETRGFKFISYAVWWIRQSILQSIAEDGRMIRLPLNKIGNLKKINRATIKLIQNLERTPSEEELSEYLIKQELEKGQYASGPNKGKNKGDISKFSIFKIKNAISEGYMTNSLDAPISSDSDSGTMLDILKGNSENEFNKFIESADIYNELKRIVETLNHREQKVLIYHFGLFDEESISLEEIGRSLGISRERVRQIKENGVKKLKSRIGRTSLKNYIC